MGTSWPYAPLGPNEVILGKSLAATYNVSTGDEIELGIYANNIREMVYWTYNGIAN